MFRRAHQLGKIKDGVALAEAAARIGPRFGVSHTGNEAPAVIPLARGPVDPIVFCIPSLVATGGPHEYARFAKSFQNRREVVAVPVPGFAADELLPSILAAAAGAQAAAIRSTPPVAGWRWSASRREGCWRTRSRANAPARGSRRPLWC